MLRGTLQFFDLENNPALFLPENRPAPGEEKLYSELLFSYELNPQTVIFVGYSDTRRAIQGSGLDPENRTLFVKLSYAWVL